MVMGKQYNKDKNKKFKNVLKKEGTPGEIKNNNKIKELVFVLFSGYCQVPNLLERRQVRKMNMLNEKATRDPCSRPPNFSLQPHGGKRSSHKHTVHLSACYVA